LTGEYLLFAWPAKLTSVRFQLEKTAVPIKRREGSLAIEKNEIQIQITVHSDPDARIISWRRDVT
jgi:hypothetical protein